MLRRLGRRLRREAGFTLIELVIAMAIMGLVIGSLTLLLVQGTKAELDLNKRFQAQSAARVGLTRLRRDVHCASAVTPVGATASVTLTLPGGSCGNGAVTWCAVASGSRWSLYRRAGVTCGAAGGTRWAEALTTGTPFTVSQQSSTNLAIVHVELPVNPVARRQVRTYELRDDLVLRNSVRAAP